MRRRIGMGERGRGGGREGGGRELVRERANEGCFSRPNGGRTGMEKEREGEGEAVRVRSLARSLSSRVLLPPPLPLLSRPPSSSEED